MSDDNKGYGVKDKDSVEIGPGPTDEPDPNSIPPKGTRYVVKPATRVAWNPKLDSLFKKKETRE